MVQFCVSISPESVGAYRIRPDVGEQEMTATSILSLKACRKTQRGISRPGKCSPGTEQGFPAWGNVPRKPSKVFPLGKMFPWNRARFSRPGKCSPETEQGFPAWENVPLEPGKVFPPGKMFPWNRARFSRSGKCSSETEQGFPAWENVPRKPSKVFPVNFIMNSSFVGQIRSCGGRMRYAPTYLPFVRWGYGEGSFRFISCFSP